MLLQSSTRSIPRQRFLRSLLEPRSGPPWVETRLVRIHQEKVAASQAEVGVGIAVQASMGARVVCPNIFRFSASTFRPRRHGLQRLKNCFPFCRIDHACQEIRIYASRLADQVGHQEIMSARSKLDTPFASYLAHFLSYLHAFILVGLTVIRRTKAHVLDCLSIVVTETENTFLRIRR
jgi:hypothetical protein